MNDSIQKTDEHQWIVRILALGDVGAFGEHVVIQRSLDTFLSNDVAKEVQVCIVVSVITEMLHPVAVGDWAGRGECGALLLGIGFVSCTDQRSVGTQRPKCKEMMGSMAVRQSDKLEP
jgi:hypothetical protein